MDGLKYQYGQNLWTRFVADQRRSYPNCTNWGGEDSQKIQADWAEVSEKAYRMVERLAPELRIDPVHFRLYSGDSDIMVFDGGLAEAYPGARGSCCSNTFADDPYVPPLEKCLTFYLYWKHFRDRFYTRPDYHVPAAADPVGMMNRNQFMGDGDIAPCLQQALQQVFAARRERQLREQQFRQMYVNPFRPPFGE